MTANEQFSGLAGSFGTILADPPWRFQNRTGKMAPEHRRLRRYRTMDLEEICAQPIAAHAADRARLKPHDLYRIIEQCSPGPRLELFARERVAGWTQWGDELDTYRKGGAVARLE